MKAVVCPYQGMVDSNGEPVDAAFYRRFWGLQPVFMNPGPAMRPGPWAGVVNDLTAVLDEFDKQKTIAAASSAPDAEGAVTHARPDPVHPPQLLQLHLLQRVCVPSRGVLVLQAGSCRQQST